MRLLLDTHVWLWSLVSPVELSPITQAALVDARHVLYLSPISVWEAMLLIERGRIQVNTTPKEWVEKALIRSPLYEAPLTHEIAVRSRIINLPHQDPADRFIAATALELNLTLITADDRLLKHSVYPPGLRNEIGLNAFEPNITVIFMDDRLTQCRALLMLDSPPDNFSFCPA